MGHLVLAVVLVGCGRIDFEHRLADAGPVDTADAAAAPEHWTIVQSGATNSASLAVSATSDHDLIVVAVHLANQGTPQSITDDAGNTYIQVPGSRATDASPPDAVELWYAADSHAGATMIAVTSAATIVSVVAWEVSGVRATSPVDTAATIDNQAATTTPLGPMIITATPGELVIAVAIVANGVTGIHAGNEFTNDYRTRGNGWAHITTATAAAGVHQAEWDQGTAGTYCATAAAFFAP